MFNFETWARIMANVNTYNMCVNKLLLFPIAWYISGRVAHGEQVRTRCVSVLLSDAWDETRVLTIA